MRLELAFCAYHDVSRRGPRPGWREAIRRALRSCAICPFFSGDRDARPPLLVCRLLLFSCGDSSPESPPPLHTRPRSHPRSRRSLKKRARRGRPHSRAFARLAPAFLRRLKAIENGEHEIVILTEGATLTDVYKEGSFRRHLRRTSRQ